MDLSWLLGVHDSFNLAVEVLMEFQKVAGASGSGLQGEPLAQAKSMICVMFPENHRRIPFSSTSSEQREDMDYQR